MLKCPAASTPRCGHCERFHSSNATFTLLTMLSCVCSGGPRREGVPAAPGGGWQRVCRGPARRARAAAALSRGLHGTSMCRGDGRQCTCRGSVRRALLLQRFTRLHSSVYVWMAWYCRQATVFGLLYDLANTCIQARHSLPALPYHDAAQCGVQMSRNVQRCMRISLWMSRITRLHKKILSQPFPKAWIMSC